MVVGKWRTPLGSKGLAAWRWADVGEGDAPCHHAPNIPGPPSSSLQHQTRQGLGPWNFEAPLAARVALPNA
eukprot:2880704-Pyramimonas_sp.AAC.1